MSTARAYATPAPETVATVTSTHLITVSTPPAATAAELCSQLESGNILYFPQTPFTISPEDRELLLGQKRTATAFHKNVAYRPAENRVTGLDKSESADAPQLKVDLHFKSMDDFEPENVVRQVKPLKELMDLRTKLSNLRASLQGNDKLEEALLGAVGDQDKLNRLKKELDKPTGGSNG